MNVSRFATFYNVPARRSFEANAAKWNSSPRSCDDLPAASPGLLRSACASTVAMTFRAWRGFAGRPVGPRYSALMGREVDGNVLEIEAEREGVRLWGLAGLPTLSRRDTRHQYL
ncbi:MAG: hypothetical protein R3D03_01645 [Geminicoccaceae bacterium]